MLPIDLIPDFIPIIGLYDDYLALIIAYSGFIVCITGVIFSLKYYEKALQKKDNVDINVITQTVHSAFQFVYNAANNAFG